jgi:hypothetical protein
VPTIDFNLFAAETVVESPKSVNFRIDPGFLSKNKKF